MRQTVAFMATPFDAELDTLFLADFRGPVPERSQFVRLCYKNCPFVSSGLDVERSLLIYAGAACRLEAERI